MNSWKNLPQKTHTDKQRIYFFVKIFIILLTLALVIVFSKQSETVQIFRHLKFETDGVLRENWFIEHIDLPKNKNLLSIDLVNLREIILKISQVEAVEIRRKFPDTLIITVKERIPCAKLLLKNKSGTKLGLIDLQGNIFLPVGYDREILKLYPTVSEISEKIMRKNKIVEFDKISKLLNRLKEQYPDLYAHISNVSLKNFDPFLEEKWQNLEVKIDKSLMIILPIQKQKTALKKLENVLHALSSQQRKTLKIINVALTNPTVEFLE